MSKLSVLLVASYLDGTEVGESFTAYKLIEAMSHHADLTVLAFECKKGPPLARQLPNAEVVTWPDPTWVGSYERLGAMLKPHLFILGRHVERWVRQATARGQRFDIAHQILPRAPRYPTVLRKLGMPYIIGSLGGSLETPDAFLPEEKSAKWFTRLRALDGVRLRFDPWLRASYARAEVVLGVAPYMKDVLRDVPMKRFEPFLGLGIDDVAPDVSRTSEPGTLKLLHVGRAVRTKGLRDVVRALAALRDMPDVTLTSVGDGEEIPACRAEAQALGVSDRVTFMGKLPREDIEELYKTSDAFIFPSFRESMGGVLYEAMRWGLPLITVCRGGPDWIADESCALKVDVESPDQLARDLAGAIRRLAGEPALRTRLGDAAKARVGRDGPWPTKAQAMLTLYKQTIDELHGRAQQ